MHARRNSWITLLLASLTVLGAPASGAPVDVPVTFEWIGGAPEELPRPLLLKAEPEGAAPGSGNVSSWELSDGETVIQLESRYSWYLWAEAPGYWGEELWVESPAQASQTPLRMFPTGTVEGRVTLDGPVGSLELDFDPATGSQEPRPIGGFVECPVADGAFRCELPASRLDLRLGAGLHVPQVLANVRVRAGRSRDLGDLELRLGAAVAGRVELDSGATPSADCKALLVRQRDRRGEGGATLVETVDEDGTFEFMGVPAGRWELAVQEPGFVSPEAQRLSVVAGERLEMEVVHLLSPTQLDLVFLPPLDPFGEGWRFTLTRFEDSKAHHALEEQAGSDGIWIGEELPPGEYRVELADPFEPGWFQETFTLEAGGGLVTLEPRVIAVEGQVTIGGDPLAAQLAFRGASREEHKLETDEEGELSGLLPRAGRWNLSVSAPEEGVSLELPDFEVVDDGTGRALMQVDVPATRLEGVVTDPRGEPVSGATIRIRSRLTRRVERVETDAEGRFLVRGMAEEIVTVRAEMVGARPTSWFEVSLEKGATQEPLQIVITMRRQP